MTSDDWKILFVAVGAVFDAALAAALGYWGRSKGYPFFLCFMLGLAASPFLGWIIMALLPEREQKYTPPAELLLAIEEEKARMAADRASTT